MHSPLGHATILSSKLQYFLFVVSNGIDNTYVVHVFTAHAHTFNVDDYFHLEMIVYINVIILDSRL